MAMNRPLWLVATDFSPGADAAFRTAVAMAEVFGAQLLVVHVVLDLRRLPGFFVTKQPIDGLQHDLEEEAARKLAELLDAARGQGIPAQVELLRGTPVPALLKAAHDERAAMIVVGQAAADKASRQMCGGSTAGGLFRHPPCPVLVVPPPTEES
ncbi:MAG: universal stress protein [Nitrospirota bacterium]|jgi:nucleotide-binding universal stress UspA family protein